MQQSNMNTQEIRSILAAMERSIDDARRKRLNQPDDVPESRTDEASERETAENRSSQNSAQSPQREESSSGDPAARDHVESNRLAHESPVHDPEHDPQRPARLKARPKRPSAFFRPQTESGWQSRAG